MAPPAAAAVSGAGAPAPVAVAVAVALLAVGVWWARRSGTAGLRLSRLGVAAWCLLAALAVVQDVRVSWYMADGTRLLASALPNGFVTVHECLSGYTEATRLALEGRDNIYDDRHYTMPDGGPRYMVRRDGTTQIYDDARLRALFAGGQIPRVAIVHVDEYEYPPPFLLLPYAMGAPVGRDLFRIRPVWFGLQAALLWTAFLVSVGWPAIDPASRPLAWLPALWLAPPTLVGLQYGNAQTTVMAISVLALAAIARRRDSAGGALLGFAATAKVFPGVLLLVLAASRRWRAIALTSAWAGALIALALLVFGRRPFDDFMSYQIPAIASGAAFAFNDKPEWIPTNYGAYALVAKLRLLGVPGMTHQTGIAAASVYGLVVLGCAVLVVARAWRRGSEMAGALDSPVLWLALLNLAALRSPYVGDGYAQVGTLWLLALVASRRDWSRGQWGVIALLFVAWATTLEGFLSAHPPAWITILAVATQVSLIGFNLWVLVPVISGRAARRAEASAPS
jgi:hypothetical protein